MYNYHIKLYLQMLNNCNNLSAIPWIILKVNNQMYELLFLIN